MTLASLRKVVAVLGASVEVQVRGLGSEVDRLLDERHAGLVGLTAGLLRGDGWEVRPEVSYSEWGERGSIDLLAWHGPARALLVVEVKSELASVEATLRKHDEKVRLASGVAVRRLGWRPSLVGRLLVLPADRTARRRVASHAAVLDEVYPARARAIRAWCRRPSGTLAGILFLTDAAGGSGMSAVGRRQRVRAPRPGGC